MMKMMRAQYESLAVHDLKEIARARGLRSVSGMKKAELIDAMVAMDAEDEKKEENGKAGAARMSEERSRKAEESVRPQRETEEAVRPQREAEEPVRSRREAEESVRSQREAEEPVRSRREAEEPVRPQRETEEAVRLQREAEEGAVRERRTEARPQRESRSESADRTRKGPARPERPGRTDGQSDWARAARGQRPVQRNEKAQAAGTEARSERYALEEAEGRTQEAAGGKVIMSRSQEPRYYSPYNKGMAPSTNEEEDKFPAELDSGITVSGILEVMPDGYGFIRSNNYLPGESDVYVAPSQIRRFNLKTGDILEGNTRIRTQNEKFSALLYVKAINGYAPEVASRRSNFEDMTPIFPDSRLKLEKYGSSVAMRIVDLLSPIGKGQRGMIVSPPKAGKTTLLKEIAISVKKNYPDMHLIILLIDERPEEVTDIRETVEGPNVEVVYSTFDELPDHHKRVAEMVVERARRLVEHKRDVMILLDSITRLTRAYNLVVPPSGRTLSGGIDPAALHMPKRFFGAARNMREGGSLTILATALVDTGSRMDDVIYEEFKGTGNMELVLDRKLSEKRLFPAIDIAKTSTRREDLLLSAEEMEAINIVRRALNGMKADEAADKILDLFAKTRTNAEFVQTVKKMRFIG